MTRFFHVSDIHFGAEDVEAIAWFGTVVRDERPDGVVMTGDLTMRAKKSEFEAASAFLSGLGVPVSVEVGNHDIPYYYNPIRRLLRPYRRYLAVEQMVEKPLDLKSVTVVPLRTTARAQLRFDWSKGNVTRPRLAESLALVEAAPADHAVIVACHHPLMEADTRASANTRGGKGALAALAAAGADAVLSGHVHDPFDIAVDIGGRSVRMIGAGTLSRRTRDTPASFNDIRVGADGSISVTVRTMAG
ncbi:3',5'-cyclic AMP phosphodiesterase CpdA [Sphingomonas jejuensis]|uniref:3',5'-cyclic AMP phosphodiesterase CpdA n=1 Tax=Sphingomonas jejuensis TaxID=904715 RepID=A0ABX0XHB9_9SPHN|nr:metallophosphoesterase [Sphingomonas jejuensis]NJC32728.1 3',5'-cyclic AMP phosphodiesterase CpdA [Sphingomonas jejuensis]